MLFVIVPDVPVSSTVVVPLGALRAAVHEMVTFTLPLAGTVTGLAEGVAETPLGSLPMLNETDESNPSTLVRVSVVWTVSRSRTVKDDGDSDIVKFALPLEAGLTVSETVVVALRLPEVPVMVTFDVPVAAEELAVRLRTLAPLVGFVANEAVTPLGKPDADRVALPENPSTSVTEIVLVPAAPPWVIDTVAGEADRVKLGVEEEDPARRVMRALPFGLPQPVTRS